MECRSRLKTAGIMCEVLKKKTKNIRPEMNVIDDDGEGEEQGALP